MDRDIQHLLNDKDARSHNGISNKNGTSYSLINMDVDDYNDPLNKAKKVCNCPDETLQEEHEATPTPASASPKQAANPAATATPFPTGAFVDGGSFDYFQWTFDSNGLLTVYGEGELDDNSSWSSHRRDIVAFQLNEGITP